MLAADHPGRRGVDPHASHLPVPGPGPAPGVRDQQLHRRERPGRRDVRHDAARAADQRRRGAALPHILERQRRDEPDHRHLRRHARSGSRHRGRAEPRQRRPGSPAGRGEADGRVRHQELTELRVRRRDLLARRSLRPALHEQLRRRVRARQPEAHRRRRRRPDLRRAALRDAVVARAGPDGEPRADRHGRAGRAARAERAGGRGTGGTAAGAGRPELPDQRARRGAAERAFRVRGRHREGGPGRDTRPAEGHRPCRAGRRGLRVDSAVQRKGCGGPRGHAALDRECARSRKGGIRRAGSLVGALPAGDGGPSRLGFHGDRERVDPGGRDHARRSHRARRARDVPVPRRLARDADPHCHDPGVA